MRVQADNGSGFAANRTDFRDENHLFCHDHRFYDGDPANNVLCRDNQEAQVSTKAPAGARLPGPHRPARLHQGTWLHRHLDQPRRTECFGI
jgi:hypothetical protein